MDGLSWDRFLDLSWYEQWAMQEELTIRVEESNQAAVEEDGSPAARPKEFRR